MNFKNVLKCDNSPKPKAIAGGQKCVDTQILYATSTPFKYSTF